MMQAATKPREEVLTALDGIDWSFDSHLGYAMDNRDVFDARRHHWYPATFVPELPRALIQLTTHQNALVLDPFGGIGTTMFQAFDVGRRAIIQDLNQVAVKFCRNLVILLRSPDSFPEEPAMPRTPSAMVNQGLGQAPRNSHLEALRPWFNPETFEGVGFVHQAVLQESDEATRAAMEIALSASLMGLVGQEKGWGYIADNMRPRPEQIKDPKPAIARFLMQYRRLAKDVTEFKQRLRPESLAYMRSHDPEEIVRLGDSRTVDGVRDGSADLLLTSPPYPSMADYATSQRLSYYLHGSEPDEDLRIEIGARRRRTRSQALEEYRQGLAEVNATWLPKISQGGYACFVMPAYPDSDPRRKETVEATMGDVEAHGFTRVTEFRRELPTRRRHHNEAWGRLSQEWIFLFQRED
jgi:DNA modification methylase